MSFHKSQLVIIQEELGLTWLMSRELWPREIGQRPSLCSLGILFGMHFCYIHPDNLCVFVVIFTFTPPSLMSFLHPFPFLMVSFLLLNKWLSNRILPGLCILRKMWAEILCDFWDMIFKLGSGSPCRKVWRQVDLQDWGQSVQHNKFHGNQEYAYKSFLEKQTKRKKYIK